MAVDNFIAFKKLMVKRNTELNNEAMNIQKTSQQDSRKKSGMTNEELALREAEMESAAIAASLAEAQKADTSNAAPDQLQHATTAPPASLTRAPGLSDEKLLIAKAIEESQNIAVIADAYHA